MSLELMELVFNVSPLVALIYLFISKPGDDFSTLEKSDTVIVSEVSRLERSTLQILEIMKQAKKKEPGR